MSMTAFCVPGRAWRPPLTWLATSIFLAFVAVPVSAEEPITVSLDHARIIKLPERAQTIVIGDPLIADLSIQPGGLAVITAKGYGATNIIAMDHDGAVLMEKNIEVHGPSDPTVVVYRGVTRQTYSCNPECERRITLGDTGVGNFDDKTTIDQDYFTKTIEQTSTRNDAAMKAGSGPDNSSNSNSNSAAQSRH
jgi:hypothetical protein